MKKIGILTIHDSPSYGGTLQCYALWRFLTDQGYDCDVIDLHRPRAHEDYRPSKKFKACRKPTWKKRIKETLKRILNILQKKSHSLYSKGATPKFKEFASLMSMSKPFTKIDDLYAYPPHYDVYMAGSDQLWNPSQPYCIEPYFLTFISSSEAKKISYATSIGITDLTIAEKEKIKIWLSDFTTVSVREKSAKILLDSFVDKDINMVLDPTFLLRTETWKELSCCPLKKDSFILLFTLGNQPQLLDYCITLSKQSGKKLIVLRMNQKQPTNEEYIALTNAGPREFLGYIAQADLVITDSFHGTVFSILMKTKNFFTYISNPQRSSRITDLLEMLSLSGHILPEVLHDSYEDLTSKSYNRCAVEEVIDREKKKSIAFLTNSLESRQ